MRRLSSTFYLVKIRGELTVISFMIKSLSNFIAEQIVNKNVLKMNEYSMFPILSFTVKNFIFSILKIQISRVTNHLNT